MRHQKERGAIVIEATISLTAFIFMIFTILSIVDICYVQAKMSVALNSAAKEMAQYSYLYYKFGINELEEAASSGTENAVETSKKTIDGVSTFIETMSEAETNIQTGNFEGLVSNIDHGVNNIDSLVTMYADQLADDPKGFIFGMAKMAGNDLKEHVKVLLAQVMAKAFMEKNLRAFEGDEADNFLRRYRVVDGMDGLDFKYTALMAYGTSNRIQLVVTYDVQVIKLLNLDFKFTFRQCAQTTAWGNGVSLITPEISNTSQLTVWDGGDSERGKTIVANEKKKYTYTSTNKGFDAYNNANGKNEFVTIVSINTFNDSYSTSDGIKNKLSSSFSSLYSNVAKLDETITVKDKNGNEVTLNSPESTRTYKIQLVVPDSADMTIVNKAIADFKNSRYDTIEVEVVKGYGNPTKTESKEESK